jgi:hypothetical protein
MLADDLPIGGEAARKLDEFRRRPRVQAFPHGMRTLTIGRVDANGFIARRT